MSMQTRTGEVAGSLTRVGSPSFLCAWLVLLGASSVARAQSERPSEEEIFGADRAAESAPSAGGQRLSEEEIFGEPAPAPDEQASQAESVALKAPALAPAAAIAPEIKPSADPLAIGGQLYLRSNASWREADGYDDLPLSAPLLVDGYLDARPNDRVRGLVLARLHYDPTVDPDSARLLGSDYRLSHSALDNPALPAELKSSLESAFVANPRILLDQLWIRFDLLRTVFVTAGKQHVKWGTAHFWNPTDLLHAARRDPLAVFDERTGVTMVKLHVPWEAPGWNFYGIGLVDLEGPIDRVARLGAAGRAEIVLGTAEFGFAALARRGARPRVGADLSAGVGPFDVYAEAAATMGGETILWRRAAAPDPAAGPAGLVESYTKTGLRPQATVGVDWSWRYSDEDSLSLGIEYFVNPNGVADAELYLPLMLRGAYVPFYAGRQYAGLYLIVPKPGTWNNTNLIVSTLSNLSDRSFLTRFDCQVLVLTYLRVEAYAAAHYGHQGELRFGFDYPMPAAGQALFPSSLRAPTPVLDVGLAVNMSF